MPSSGRLHRSRKHRTYCRLLIVTVFTAFWLTLTLCYYFVHNQDHDVDESSAAVNGQYLADLAPRLARRAGVLFGVAAGAESLQLKGVMHVKEKYAVDVDFARCDNETERYFNVPGAITGGHKLRRFTGRKLVPYVSVYPSDDTISLTSNQTNKNGNTVIARKVVDKLRKEFHTAVKGSLFESGEVVRVERMSLPAGLAFGGRLFLLDMVSHLNVPSYHHHTEYVLESGIPNSNVCRPEGYNIDLFRKIYIIFTVWDLSDWVVRMINAFEKLQERTGDENFELIVADFNSSDDNLKTIADISERGFTIRVLKMAGSYNKAIGIVAATNLVKNPNDIIFLCDLHLEIPTTFLKDIRKHVIRNKMVFAPVVGKLDQGSTLDDPQGQWDTNGFGLIAMTKSDWDMIGGMNTEEFNGDQWGGEDWEMIDRIVESGLFVNRWRVPGLFHHFHNKTGMWPGGRYQLMAGGTKIKTQNNITINR